MPQQVLNTEGYNEAGNSLMSQLIRQGWGVGDIFAILGSSYCALLMVLEPQDRIAAVRILLTWLEAAGVWIDNHGRIIVDTNEEDRDHAHAADAG